MKLHISESLRLKLLALREQQLQHPYPDEVLVSHDVVILTLGLGPAIYLGLDGRVVIWHYMEDEKPRVTENIAEIAPGLVIGAKWHKLPELFNLLPPCPANGLKCQTCEGLRWSDFSYRSDEDDRRFVCWHCSGLGWQLPGSCATPDALQ